MKEIGNKGKVDKQRQWLFGIAFVVLLLIVYFLSRPALIPPKPSIPQGMLPREADAIVRALGPYSLNRVVQVISIDRVNIFSGGTHNVSGIYHGKPYGLAFDIALDDPAEADSDVHKLRMEGIAAWRRGPGAPGGGENLGPHIHCVWPGVPTHNAQNREQVSSFVHGYKGVVEKSPDRSTWRDPTITRAEIGKVRLLYEEVYGKGSLATVPLYESRHHTVYRLPEQ